MSSGMLKTLLLLLVGVVGAFSLSVSLKGITPVSRSSARDGSIQLLVQGCSPATYFYLISAQENIPKPSLGNAYLWEFENNTYDTYAYKQLESSALRYTPGMCGQGIYLNGVSYVTMNQPAFNASYLNDFTISFWLKNPNFGNATEMSLMNQRTGCSVNAFWDMTFLAVHGGAEMRWEFSDGSMYANWINVTYLQNFQTYHIAVVRQSGYMGLYINGSLIKSAFTGNSRTKTVGPLVVGVANGCYRAGNIQSAVVDDLLILDSYVNPYNIWSNMSVCTTGMYVAGYTGSSPSVSNVGAGTYRVVAYDQSCGGVQTYYVDLTVQPLQGKTVAWKIDPVVYQGIPFTFSIQTLFTSSAHSPAIPVNISFWSSDKSAVFPSSQIINTTTTFTATITRPGNVSITAYAGGWADAVYVYVSTSRPGISTTTGTTSEAGVIFVCMMLQVLCIVFIFF